AVTPDAIRSTARELGERLQQEGIELEVFPTAEVMADPDLEAAWDAGRLLGVGGHSSYLLVEMPHRVFVDLRPIVGQFRRRRVRIILAHPERHPELLHESGALNPLIAAGCLVQVNAGSVTDPATPADEVALRSWFRRSCVRLLGSDGHSPRRRKP